MLWSNLAERTRQWSWSDARVGAMHAAFVAMPVVAVFAHKGLVFIFLLAALTNLRRDAVAALWHRNRLLVAGIVLLCVWAPATLSFAPNPDPIRASSHLILIPVGVIWVVSLSCLSDAQSRRLADTLVMAVWMTIALFGFQLVSYGALTWLWYASTSDFKFGNALYETMATGVVLLAGLIWPVVAWLCLHRRRWAALTIAGAASVCIFAMPLLAAAVGVLAGGVCFLSAWRWPRTMLTALLVCFVGYAAVAPAISANWPTIGMLRDAAAELPGNWMHRLIMWRYVSGEIATAGAFGAGYDASRTISRRGEPVGDMAGLDGLEISEWKALRLHPHNAALQIRLELGAPGIAALALIVAGIGTAALHATMPGLLRASVAAALATMFAPLLLSFGIWQGWWLATLMLVAGVTVLLIRAAGGIRKGEIRIRNAS